MYGLHPEMGVKGIIFAVILELLFLAFCLVFVGLGLSEMKKRKRMGKNFMLVVLGFSLAALSLYVTKLLVEG